MSEKIYRCLHGHVAIFGVAKRTSQVIAFLMARAKRVRVVQDAIKRANRRPTRHETADTTPQKATSGRETDAKCLKGIFNIDYFRRRNTTPAQIYYLKSTIFLRRNANLAFIYYVEMKHFGRTSDSGAHTPFENRQFSTQKRNYGA